MIDWLSAWLSPIQAILLRRGYERSYIGGSGAREILDHIFFGSKISLRDLDVYLIKHGAALVTDIDVLCDDVRGLFEVGPLREKRRANPRLPGKACYDYLTGYGVHLSTPDRPILSLSVLHRTTDLGLNGLFDIDTIFLVVPNDKPFHWFADQVAQGTAEILDPYDGYRAWCDRTPEIVHWAEVERCYPRSAFRIARSLAKAEQLRLPEKLRSEYRSRRPSVVVIGDLAELRRDFLKILGDRYWAEELEMVAELLSGVK